MSEVTADPSGIIVQVRRQWNDWRSASYRLSDIADLHWSDVSGGVYAPAPQLFVYGYVQCDGMIQGELAHSGAHGPCPHSVKVCILKTGNQSRLGRGH